MTAAPVRILLADDHTLFREGIRELLEAEPDLSVIAQAATGAAAVSLAAALHPDVVLLDVEMPGDTVQVTVAGLLAASATSRVLVLSMSDDPLTVRELLTAGVNGYLLKNVSRQELVAAIRGVHADGGRVVVSISQSSLARMYARPAVVLSDREREVLALVARALSNAQVADRLFIAEGTVKRHLRNIFDKLGAVSRIDAVNKALAQSLIPPIAN